MPKLMIVVVSMRPGRIGLPIANWVHEVVTADGRFEIDWADLAGIKLPFMDEPNHPKLHQYTQQHTFEWSARVDAADAFIFVSPEYNFSYAPSLKNALDYLNREWWRKPLGTVSYGGISGGTRGVTAIRPTEVNLGLVATGPNVEIPWAAKQINDDGMFEPLESQEKVLAAQLDELILLDATLRPLRR
ncbi:MAG TPA: NAD(P)H-dependent oxidoreductase [Microbacteriaceae bacterium]